MHKKPRSDDSDGRKRDAPSKEAEWRSEEASGMQENPLTDEEDMFVTSTPKQKDELAPRALNIQQLLENLSGNKIPQQRMFQPQISHRVHSGLRNELTPLLAPQPSMFSSAYTKAKSPPLRAGLASAPQMAMLIHTPTDQSAPMSRSEPPSARAQTSSHSHFLRVLTESAPMSRLNATFSREQTASNSDFAWTWNRSPASQSLLQLDAPLEQIQQPSWPSSETAQEEALSDEEAEALLKRMEEESAQEESAQGGPEAASAKEESAKEESAQGGPEAASAQGGPAQEESESASAQGRLESALMSPEQGGSGSDQFESPAQEEPPSPQTQSPKPPTLASANISRSMVQTEEEGDTAPKKTPEIKIYSFADSMNTRTEIPETDKKEIIRAYLSKSNNLRMIMGGRMWYEQLAKAFIRAMWTKFNEEDGNKDAKAAVEKGYIDNEEDFEKFATAGKSTEALPWTLLPEE